MPLFIFISGYFFHAYDFRTFLTKKVKHLLIPFLLWNAFYGILIQFLFNSGFTKIRYTTDLSAFLWNSLICAWPTAFNGPSWFVIILFWSQLLYWTIHKITRGNVVISGCIVAIAYLLSLWLTFHGYSSWMHGAGIGIERILFFLLFYYAGGIYHAYIEKESNFCWKNIFTKIIICFSINIIILHFIEKKITYNIHLMSYPVQNYWLPLITACTGIYLYMQFSRIIIEKVKRHQILDFIGRHTYSVMTHHQFFFWITNTILWLIAQHNEQISKWFDYQKYMTNVYYRINTPYPGERFIYLLMGLCGPLLCCWIYDRFIQQRWHEIRDRVLDLIN